MAPSPQTPTSSHKLGITLLSTSIIAGTYTLHCLGWTPSGLMPQLTALLQDPSSKWPGTNTPLLRTFTNIPPIDFLIRKLNPFFARLVDGSNPSLSVFSFFMFGQYGVAWGLCLMESLRTGNKGKVVSYVAIFGILMQMLGFAIFFPTYLLLHLLTSPVAKLNARTHSGTAMYITPASLAVLPISIIVGYIIPSTLVMLPSPTVVSIETRQNLMAAWQAFPLHTVLIQWILSTIFSNPPKANQTKTPKPSQSKTYLTSASRVYTFLLIFATITHIPALFLTLCPTSMLRALSPSLETTLASSNVTFSSVYIPALPVRSWRAFNLADGVHMFLFWDTYVSSFAAFVWTFVLLFGASSGQKQKDSGVSSDSYSRGGDNFTLVGLLVKIVLWTAVSGPFGAVTILLWDRDTAVSRSSKHND